MRLTPASELEQRWKKLQQYMLAEGLDAVIIVQNADLFYFTGTTQSGNLYVPADAAPLYMVRKDLARARQESGLAEIVPFSSMKDLPVRLAEYGYKQPSRIGMELDVVPFGFFERYRKVYPDAEFVDATPLIRRVRMIKSGYELEILAAAAVQVDKVCQRACQVIRAGMTEIELAAELEYVARRNGHLGIMRMRGFNSEMVFGHTFSGTAGTAPSYSDTPLGGVGMNPAFGQGAGYSLIERNEPIVIDFAGSVDGYMVDQTRIFSIGPVSDCLARGYDDMLKIQALMKQIVQPGISWGAVYDQCLALAVEMGYADNFMGVSGAQVSFIGHGLGVEIDEYPFIARGFDKMLFETGMVFAFEPKLVFPGVGAVGIENTFYLSDDGLRQLTFTSDELVILDRQ
jgi:Xaa-Pro dipeptidase